jgi:hypothetical protein
MVIGMSNQIAVGSRVKTAKGTEGMIAQILEGGYLLDTGQRVRAESIATVIPPEPKQPPAKVEPPAPEPEGIEIGDRLARSTLAKKPYPKGWFPNGIDDRPTTIDAITATVTGFSADGYWASTDDGKQYHVSEYAIDCGDWKKVRQDNQQN